MTDNILTQDRLRALLAYDPDTGIFTWITPTGNRVKKGAVCACQDKYGYVVIRLNSRLYKAHQLAWLYMFGEFSKELDHINRVPHDNRIVNLRVASRSEQMHNAGMLRNNTSGVKGVSWHKASKKWHVRIWSDGVCHSFGYFDSLELAKRERDAKYSLLAGRRNGVDEPALVTENKR